MNFTILHRQTESEEWKTITESDYENERHLQEMILEHLQDNPDLVPVQEIDDGRKPIKVIIDEYNPISAGSADLLGLDEEGNITLIEVKLQENSETRRRIVAQILDYAASLWETEYEDLDRFFLEKTEKGIVQRIENLVDDFDLQEFQNRVRDQLDEGDFTLFLVVDDVDENLKRILEYLNKQEEGLSIYAVAIRYFKNDRTDDELLIPQLYGPSQKAEDKKRRKESTEWTFGRVEKELQNEDSTLAKRKLELAELAEKENVFIPRNSVTGTRFGMIGKSGANILVVRPDGHLFSRIKRQKADEYFNSDQERKAFIKALNELPICNYDLDITKNRKSDGPIQELEEQEFQRLKGIIREFCVNEK